MILNNFFYDGKPDSGAVDFLFFIQTLEYFKDAVFVFWVKTDTIVWNADVAIFFS